jgi:cytochrome c biogenesis protein CcmG, thiol:disulfide interchange protein DsbE
MPAWKRGLYLSIAVLCIAAAVGLIVNAGLPVRAEFTGLIGANGIPIAPEVNAMAPPFELPTLNSSLFNTSQLHGAPVVINFWATWCEPCRVEMPSLQAIYDAYQSRGLRLVAVNLGETAETARAWAQRLGLTFDIVLDEQQQVSALYQLRGQPSTYVIAPNGIITHIFYGPITEATLIGALAPYFPT